MAYYRASQVIKMRRNALGHSREEYLAEGPSDRTIFRMENGKVHIKETTYRRLSRAMDEEESTRQGILQTEDMSVLWLTNKITRCLYVKEYEKAEKLIAQLEEKLDSTVEVNRRYLNSIKAELQFYKGSLDSKSYGNEIEDSLSHGDKKFDELIKDKWPFGERECNRILKLVEVVRKEKNYNRQKELLEQLLDVLDTGYMGMEYRAAYMITARYRMGDVLGNLGFHRDAIALDEETIAMCKEQQDRRFLPELNYDIFWNYMMLSEKETLTQQEEAYRKECLLKAYCLNKAEYSAKNRYKERVLEFYPDEI